MLLTGHIKLHLSRVLSMDIGDHNLVFALIIGLDLSDAERDGACLSIGDVLEAATFDDLCDSLVELEGRRWVALNLDGKVASVI